jgi:putative colanic acid biosynthesis glycosyltransferase
MISLVTVVLNDLPGLRRTYGSLPAPSLQTGDLEWVVVDGGSSDGCVAWLEELDDPRLHFRSGPDGGIYDAMNVGTGLASGSHVMFLNAGDELAQPAVLGAVHERLAGVDLAYGDAIEVDATGWEAFRPARDPSWLPRGMFTHHQSMLFSRERLLVCPYRTQFRLSADYDLVARWFRDGAPVVDLGVTLVRFHLGGRSEVARRSAIREDTAIRREVFGMGLVRASGLALAHHVHLFVKRVTPRTARQFRSSV